MTFCQRFGSLLNLNCHFHALMPSKCSAAMEISPRGDQKSVAGELREGADMKRLLVILSLCAATLLTACLGTTIPPGKAGIKYIALDDGGLEQKVRPEGFYFQWWWNDVIMYDVTWQVREEEVEVLTSDDLHVPAAVAVTFRARQSELYRLHTEVGQSYYVDVVRPAFVTIARSEFAKYAHNQLAKNGPAIEQEIVNRLRTTLSDKPIDVDHVSITHIKYDRAVTGSISTKLVKEQVAEQKRYEVEIAKQDAEIARTLAQGRGDAIRIEAEGQAQAVVIKGKAQAEAQRAIAATLDKQYLQYKAFDGSNTSYYFVPVGKDGLPIIVDTSNQKAR